jgi:hypothetical protein
MRLAAISATYRLPDWSKASPPGWTMPAGPAPEAAAEKPVCPSTETAGGLFAPSDPAAYSRTRWLPESDTASSPLGPTSTATG